MLCVLIIFAQINSIKITSSIQKSLANIKKESPVDESNVFLEKNDEVNKEISTGMNVIQVTSFGVITISQYANIDELNSKLAWTKCSVLYGNSHYSSSERDKGFIIVDKIDKLTQTFPKFFPNFDELVENIRNQAGSDGYQQSFLVVRDNYIMAIVNFISSVKSEEDTFKYSELVVYLNNIIQTDSHPNITSEAINELSSFKDLHFGEANEQEYMTYKQITDKQKKRHDKEINKENKKIDSMKPKEKKEKKEKKKEEKNEDLQSQDDNDEVFLAKDKKQKEEKNILLAKENDKQATLAKDEDNQATLAKEVNDNQEESQEE